MERNAATHETTKVDSTTCFPITLTVAGITTRVKHNHIIFVFGHQYHITFFFFLNHNYFHIFILFYSRRNLCSSPFLNLTSVT